MTDNPDNPMAAPLTRAEEIRLWGDEQASEAAEQRTLDVLLEALQAVTATEMFMPDHPQRQAAYKAARAAIAKATQ